MYTPDEYAGVAHAPPAVRLDVGEDMVGGLYHLRRWTVIRPVQVFRHDHLGSSILVFLSAGVAVVSQIFLGLSYVANRS